MMLELLRQDPATPYSGRTSTFYSYLARLRAAGYNGWVSFEYKAEEPEATGIPRALAYLKRMLAG